MSNILILGGSGFVGTSLINQAIKLGLTITCLNRSGKPLNSIFNNNKDINWIKGSALDKKLMLDVLKDKQYVVHSIGTLLESNPLSNMINVNVDYNTSYKALIRDTTENLISCINELGGNSMIKSVGYVSANSYGLVGQMIISKYIKMKKEAEELLMKEDNNFKSTIIRPGFMYGPNKPFTIPLSYSVGLGSIATLGYLPPALKVEDVAKTLLTEMIKEDNQKVKILEVSDVVKSN